MQKDLRGGPEKDGSISCLGCLKGSTNAIIGVSVLSMFPHESRSKAFALFFRMSCFFSLYRVRVAEAPRKLRGSAAEAYDKK